MSEPAFTGTGGKAAASEYTWGGQGPRRVCNAEGFPYPRGTYGDTVAAGYYIVTDSKYRTQQWVLAGEMLPWDGTPDPTLAALNEVRKSLDVLAKALGLAA